MERDGEPEPVAVCVVERDCDGLLELDICDADGDPDKTELRDAVLLTDALLVTDGLLAPLRDGDDDGVDDFDKIDRVGVGLSVPVPDTDSVPDAVPANSKRRISV
jgi:hypothetical protein